MSLQAPNMSLNFPGGGSDYSSLLGFGDSGYTPTTDFLNTKNIALPTQFGAGGVGRPDFLSWDGFLGAKNADGTATNGWGGMALGSLQGLSNLYMGMQQYGLMKDQLAFSKDAFNRNYDAQRTMTNNQIRSQNFARNAANPGRYNPMTELA